MFAGRYVLEVQATPRPLYVALGPVPTKEPDLTAHDRGWRPFVWTRNPEKACRFNDALNAARVGAQLRLQAKIRPLAFGAAA